MQRLEQCDNYRINSIIDQGFSLNPTGFNYWQSMLTPVWNPFKNLNKLQFVLQVSLTLVLWYYSFASHWIRAELRLIYIVKKLLQKHIRRVHNVGIGNTMSWESWHKYDWLMHWPRFIIELTLLGTDRVCWPPVWNLLKNLY